MRSQFYKVVALHNVSKRNDIICGNWQETKNLYIADNPVKKFTYLRVEQDILLN
jgi:hypothetical protein